MTNKDLFAEQASEYAQYRFGYPKTFIQSLAALPGQKELAWDAGCGSGQASVGLVNFFKRVLATDISAAQIEHAFQHPKIQYQVSAAEDSGLPDASVDLITAAQAVHWFNIEEFYREVKRVLKPGGAIAIWCYPLPASQPAIDEVIHSFYHHVLKGCWSPRVKLVEEGYRHLPFPFQEIPIAPFTVKTNWTYADILGHLSSWSAVKEYQRQNDRNPVAEVERDLLAAWGDVGKQVTFEWPLHIKAGRL